MLAENTSYQKYKLTESIHLQSSGCICIDLFVTKGERMNGISKLLSTDGFIQVNKILIKKLGLHEAIIIGELCAEYNYWEEQNRLEDDMFYSTRENIEDNTGLNEHYQRKALTKLKDEEIIFVIKKGLPAVNYYKINFDKLLTLLSTSASRDAEQEDNLVNLNNNKQTNITKKPVVNSKELTTTNFQFGKSKPKKPDLFSQCISILDSYDFSIHSDIRKLAIEYLRYRMSIKDKPLYANMWKGMLNKLVALCDNDIELYTAVIQQSIERGYLAFYPVAVNNKPKNVMRDIEGLNTSESMTEEDYKRLDELTEERRRRGLQAEF